MTEAIVVATGLAIGIDWRVIALVSGAVWAPVPSAVAVAVAVLVGRRLVDRARYGGDLRFVESVAGELRAGASIRASLRAACGSLDGADAIVRRLDVGEPLDTAISGIRDLLPSVGHLVESAVTVGARGGRMLPIFEELIVHAGSEAAATAELRTALAPIRASLVVLVGAPAVYLVWSALTGRLWRLLQQPGGLGLAAVGAILFMSGLGAMLLLMRRRG